MQNEIFICRSCEVEAQATVVNGDVTRIACPSCDVFLEGDDARRMYLEQINHRQLKKVQDAISRGIGKSRSKGASLRYQPATLHRPGEPFIIGTPKS